MIRLLVRTLALFILFVPATAFAWEQTMTCSTTGPYFCNAGEIPKPVQWPTRCTTYFVNENGTAQIPNSGIVFNPALLDAVQTSFQQWTNDSESDFQISYGGLTNEDRAEFSSGRENANIVVWRDEEWPYASRTAFAITSVTFSPCLLYTSPSPRDRTRSRMPSSA